VLSSPGAESGGPDRRPALSVCAEMVFVELPVQERIRRIMQLGCEVDIWEWTRHDLDALRESGGTFSSMTGYLRGNLADRAAGETLLRSAEQVVEVAAQLGCPRLVIHGTQLQDGRAVEPVHLLTGEMWLNAQRTLSRLAQLGEHTGVTFCLENLNTAVDHPGVPFARAADTLALVSAIDSPALRMMLDLYHAQIGEGNLIELLRKADRFIGQIQVADVPGRHEPGTGEVNWPAISDALRDLDYRGAVGLEAHPSGSDETAIERFQTAFASWINHVRRTS
jgi:hydroxypyruvate isomerase